MIDLQKLDSRPLSKLYTQEGFTCKHCERWEVVFYMTVALQESLRKLEKMHPFNTSFAYHFSKVYKRAQEIQKRGREIHGKIGLSDLAPAG